MSPAGSILEFLYLDCHSMVYYLFFIYHFHNLPNHILRRHAFYELPLLLPHFSRAFTPCCLHPQCRLSLAASAVGDILIVPSLLVPVLCVDGVFVPVSPVSLSSSSTVHRYRPPQSLSSSSSLRRSVDGGYVSRVVRVAARLPLHTDARTHTHTRKFQV
jgi:hypothetical protein